MTNDKLKDEYIDIQWEMVKLSIKLGSLDAQFKKLQERSKEIYEILLSKEKEKDNGSTVQQAQ